MGLKNNKYINIIKLAIWGLLASSQAFGAVGEIHSTLSPGFIRVTTYPDQSIGFELCRDAAGQDCSEIGTRHYSEGEIAYRSDRLKNEGYKLVATDVGWVVFGSGVTVGAVMLTATDPVPLAILATSGGTAALSSLLSVVHGWMEPGNTSSPFAKWDEASTLSPQRITQSESQPVAIPIELYASRLSEALQDLY